MEQLALFGPNTAITVEPQKPEPAAEDDSAATTVIPGQLAFEEETRR